MSVTFAPAITSAVDDGSFKIVCEQGGQIGDIWIGSSNAYAEAQAHSLVCEASLCRDYGAEVIEVFAADDPAALAINMSNANAVALLTALGYDLGVPVGDGLLGEPAYELCGSEDARAFLDRIDLALGVARPDDTGLTPLNYRLGDTERLGATVMDFGRAPGYLTERLTQLRELTAACLAAGLRLAWY